MDLTYNPCSVFLGLALPVHQLLVPFLAIEATVFVHGGSLTHFRALVSESRARTFPESRARTFPESRARTSPFGGIFHFIFPELQYRGRTNK